MAFSLTYKRLFEVQLLHGHHLDFGESEHDSLAQSVRESLLRKSDIRDEISIVPLAATRRQMDNLGLVFKDSPSGFFAGAEVEISDDPTPVITLRRGFPAETSFLFALHLKRAQFFNYTNLPLESDRGSAYYFSNRAGLLGASNGSISLPVPAYVAKNYLHGELTRFGTSVFESLSAGNHPAPPSAQWQALDSASYVHGGDRIRIIAGDFTNISFGSASLSAVNLKLTDPVGLDVSLGSFTAPAGTSLSQVQVDLRSVPAGRYRLEMTGALSGGGTFSRKEEVYVSADLSLRNAFGLVEIIHRPGLGDYALLTLDANPQLLQPKFNVRFRPRSTYWRYHFPDTAAPASAPGGFTGSAPVYATEKPLPLTRSFVSLSAGSRPLPQPGLDRILLEDNKLYSDIYL